jgi:hypothetical protein
MIKPTNLMKKITSNRKFKAETPVNRISKGISTRFFQFSLILTILATSILGYGQQAQQLQMSDFVLFAADGASGRYSCSSPGYAVQLSSSTTISGGSIGSFNLIKTTGTSSARVLFHLPTAILFPVKLLLQIRHQLGEPYFQLALMLPLVETLM